MAEQKIDTIEGIVDWIIEQSQHTVEQGDRFERLMLAFFKEAPVWQEQFEEVWLWKEWAGNRSETDHGIDLVAKNRGEQTFTAIQAKCYARSTTLNKPEVDSFISASGGEEFSRRILVSTTYNIGSKAQKEMDRQTKPVQVVTLSDLRDAGVDWAAWSPENFTVRRGEPKTPKDHQQRALDAVIKGFASSDRGKAIMACGTGKTYTAQLIAESVAGAGSLVLVMAPSISLVSQTITAWSADASVPITVFGVCSDSTAGDRDSGDISPYDMVVPATTDPEKLAASIKAAPDTSMRVVFSTYHSAAVVGEAQRIGGFGSFDLVICDEAHRTTGVQLSTEDTKAFQLIHDDANIEANKRLYMTATPRVYKPSQKTKAAENEAFLSSMDDEATYGPEFFKLSFREAVDLEELTDYKVLILTVEEEAVNEAFQRHTADLGEVNLPEAAQMVGCLNALAKRERVDDDEDVRAFRPGDTTPLQRAVAFSNTIRASKHFASEFERIAAEYQYVTNVGEPLSIQTDHVDGSQRTVERTRKLDWLRDQPGESISRILSNAKCLTEGIDVPSLDAVLFLEPRKSQVDIIQAVGRVMRTSPGKDFGYIVIPIAVPPGTAPEGVLKDGRFKTVWQVLSALRSHDPDMNRDINQIRFGKKPKNVDIIDASPDVEVDDPTPPETDEDGAKASDTALADQLQLEFDVEQFQELCWATMVQKVGDTAYLKRWAKNVADIAATLEERIGSLATTRGVKGPFQRFVKGLRANLNESITDDDAVAMLAQHLITRPVFESIFPDYSLLSSNPIAQAMQGMLEVLEDRDVQTETRELDAFYDSVRYHVDGIDDPHSRQSILIELYEEFFKTAFPKRSASLGIVYTPIEITDFIIRAADEALRRHFDASLSDESVHILDPFTGTGTFIVQMLRSGLIDSHDLARKYSSELHANEIQLLAYYIATVNIETAYHTLADSTGPIQAFPGIVYTDTFQLGEEDDRLELGVFPSNSQRAKSQRSLDIRVIIGNPPYSAGQDDENDDNQNLRYPILDAAIERTYAAPSSATNKRQLYDSYVRAIRWASDQVVRHDSGGIIAFVTNGGFVTNQQFDGFRKSLAEEFDVVYCLDLRGNQYTTGEISRREGGKVFDSGSRAPVAITLLVRLPLGRRATNATILYHDIGDYLDRDQKLEIVREWAENEQSLLDSIDWTEVVPNEFGDWVNQRSENFAELAPLSAEEGLDPIFRVRSLGLATGRDQWNFNSSSDDLRSNGVRYVGAYNAQLETFHQAHPRLSGKVAARAKVAKEFVEKDPERFSWTRSDYSRLAQAERYEFDPDRIFVSQYRPFFKQHLNFHLRLNAMTYRLPLIFPSPSTANRAICVPTAVTKSAFGVLMVKHVPSLHIWPEGTLVFPEYTFQSPEEGTFFDGETPQKQHNVRNETVSRFSEALGTTVQASQIFDYVYGALHRPDYATKYQDDLSKQPARLPLPSDRETFESVAQIGAKLSELHTSYDEVEPWPELEYIGGLSAGPIQKMRYGPGKDRTRIQLTDDLTIASIPEEAHNYKIGHRSALDWLIDRYQVRTGDAAIVNDPNDWAGPEYIVRLVGQLVTVSMRTQELVADLPAETDSHVQVTP